MPTRGKEKQDNSERLPRFPLVSVFTDLSEVQGKSQDAFLHWEKDNCKHFPACCEGLHASFIAI